jgi:hypothetical protein
MLELPEELSGIHDVFHASALKKYLADESLKAPLEEIQVDDRLNFIEESIEIIEKKVKRLRRKKIRIVKVKWNAKREPEYTWEPEAEMKRKYPKLFNDQELIPGRNSPKEGGSGHFKNSGIVELSDTRRRKVGSARVA